MTTVAQFVVPGLRRLLENSEKLLVGVTPAIAARFPQGLRDGRPVTIVCNHPVFVLGHLSLYPQRLWVLQDLDPGPVAPPPSWVDLFKAGAECKDDPAGSIYPSLEDVDVHFRQSHEAALAMLPTLPDAFLEREHPDPKMRDRFPKLGHLVAFLFLAHPAMHAGQVSTWRRCWGLPPA